VLEIELMLLLADVHQVFKNKNNLKEHIMIQEQLLVLLAVLNAIHVQALHRIV
jgi:hypothetical protein